LLFSNILRNAPTDEQVDKLSPYIPYLLCRYSVTGGYWPMPAHGELQVFPCPSIAEVISPSNLSALARSDPDDNLVDPQRSWNTSVAGLLQSVGRRDSFRGVLKRGLGELPTLMPQLIFRIHLKRNNRPCRIST